MVTADPNIIIVGSGFGGLCMGAKLKQAGRDDFIKPQREDAAIVQLKARKRAALVRKRPICWPMTVHEETHGRLTIPKARATIKTERTL